MVGGLEELVEAKPQGKESKDSVISGWVQYPEACFGNTTQTERQKLPVQQEKTRVMPLSSALRDSEFSGNFFIDEILTALMTLKEEQEPSEPRARELEALEPVIEQDIDPDSYEHSEYKITVYDERAAYEYKSVDAKENSVEYVAETSQEEMVLEVQEAIDESKSAEHFNQVNMTRFDEKAQASIQELKVEYGQFMTFLMYSGEVRF